MEDIRRMCQNYCWANCSEFCPKFKFLRAVIPNHISHEYSLQMSQKSTIVSLPIINANESKYDACVNILRTYEKWIAEIYVQARLLDEIPHTDNSPVPEGPAAAGQTNAHRQDTNDDPMRDMKIPFAGDQLTRVRFAVRFTQHPIVLNIAPHLNL